MTGEALTTDDLLPIKISPRTAFPRPPTHSSVPSLLTALQSEYDAMVFETLELRKQYDILRQDLANALYTNDASMRVIARLMKERDEARDALASVHTSLGMAPSASDALPHDTEMTQADDEITHSLPESVIEQIDVKAAALSSERRARIKRGASGTYVTPATASSMQAQRSVAAAHSGSSPGVLAIDTSACGNLVLTGGKDKNVHIVDRTTDKVIAKLKGHTKAVTTVAFSGRHNPVAGEQAQSEPAPAFAVSASLDGSVRVWRHADGNMYELAHTLSDVGEVAGLDIHPTDTLVGTASRDGSWAIYSLETGERLLHVPAASADAKDEDGAGFVYESFAFHPDGQLAATGTQDGVIRIWDVKHGHISAVFRGGHDSAVHTLDFSQNGYLLGAASRGAFDVKIWDLRKLHVARTVELGEGVEAVQIRFDPTAQLLAVVTPGDVRVFGGKTLEHCTTLGMQNGQCAQWCPNDGALLVGGKDRNVHMFANTA